MKKAPALPLFGDAYLADTRHLTLEEHGAYLQLLLIAWRSEDCCLPDDDVRIARMLGVTAKKWAKLKPTIMAFWELTKSGWEQKRLTKERRFVAKKSEQNAESANARWSAKSLENNDVHDANAMRTQCANDAPPPSPTVIPLANANGGNDPEKVFWANARAYLKPRIGRDPGSLVQRWLRDFGKELTVAAINAAQVENAVDPVAYIKGYFRRNGKRHDDYNPDRITV